MANIKSAKKRISVIARRKQENRFVKSTLSTYIKKFRAQIAEGKLAEAEKALPEIVAYAYSAASKGVMPKKTASRKVSRLSLLLNKAKNGELKVVESKKTPAKKAASVAKPAVKAEKPIAKAEAKPAEEVAAKPAVKAPAKTAAKVETKTEKAPAKAKAEPAAKAPAKKETAAKPATKKEVEVKPAAKKEVAAKAPAKKAEPKAEAKKTAAKK